MGLTVPHIIYIIFVMRAWWSRRLDATTGIMASMRMESIGATLGAFGMRTRVERGESGCTLAQKSIAIQRSISGRFFARSGCGIGCLHFSHWSRDFVSHFPFTFRESSWVFFAPQLKQNTTGESPKLLKLNLW